MELNRAVQQLIYGFSHECIILLFMMKVFRPKIIFSDECNTNIETAHTHKSNHHLMNHFKHRNSSLLQFASQNQVLIGESLPMILAGLALWITWSEGRVSTWTASDGDKQCRKSPPNCEFLYFERFHSPIVEMNVDVKASSLNLNRMQVLPTPESWNRRRQQLIIKFLSLKLNFRAHSGLPTTYTNQQKLKQKVVSFLCHCWCFWVY